jgi:hypothetical protein
MSRAAICAYQASDSERADELREKVRAIWSQAWSANYAVLKFLQGARLTRLSPVRPALLLRQAPRAWDEPAGLREPRRRHRGGAGAAARRGAQPDHGPDLGIIRELAASGLVPLGDKGSIGEDDIRTRTGGGTRPASQKDANRGDARLKSWRIVRKLRCCPGAPGNWPKPSTSFRPAKPDDWKRSREYDRART